MNKHHEKLGTEKIPALLFKQSLPAVIGLLMMSLYNIVDTIFVGKGVGPLAIAGIAVVFPVQMVVMAIGQMVGIGGASLVSRNIGKKAKNEANQTLGNVLFSLLIISVPMMIFGLVFITNLLQLIGTTELIMPYARSYLEIILLATIFVSLSMGLTHIIRADGHAKVAMFTMIFGGLINIFLDWLFIFIFQMGIQGAAWGTFISHLSTAFFLLYFIISGKSSLKLNWKYIRPRQAHLKQIFGIGISAFIRQATGSILVAVMNKVLAIYGGSYAIAAFGILFRLNLLVLTPIIGIAQGFQPVAGYNYGAQRYRKTRESFKIALIWTTIAGAIGFIGLYCFAFQLMGLFTDHEAVIQIGVNALRIIVLAIPVLGVQIIGTTLFQALGKIWPALILTLSRQVLILIPLVLLLPKFFGLNGIWTAFPIADFLSLGITLAMMRPLWRKLIHASEAT